jgi:hypothetical protein
VALNQKLALMQETSELLKRLDKAGYTADQQMGIVKLAYDALTWGFSFETPRKGNAKRF